ncbi:hypothetical protein W97_05608 [Coniosporium apollinis CBS 100218]|uniref:Uncharacterized protein n=1 Tax=Coniosporium apollinis (strain CBS 100218) TaxID=1168221 RepID=R7YWA4_CONA1|nr:uncharacterized protein W97_05608 [Coniosporium apollinis CBS 100218]EON66215.1 hypothetical protein W97_05608 [Coniosporium apollinis CBS 100218]
MEPLSTVSSILSLLDISLRTTSALAKYAQATRHAASERGLLAKEALLLSSLLERLKDRTESANPNQKWLDDRADILNQFQSAYADLGKALKLSASSPKLVQESRFKAAITTAKWSFSKAEVFALLERLTRLQQYANTLLLEHQDTVLGRIDKRQQQVVDEKYKQSILSWLSPLQMNRTLRTISERAAEGSGKWFLTSEAYERWGAGTERLLWGWGIPGAGKTVLAALVVEQLRRRRVEISGNRNKFGVAVVFLRYHDPEHTLHNILASLIKQLVQERDSVPDQLRELFDNHCGQETTASLEDILDALSALVETYNMVHIVVDGLDECNDEVRWMLVEKLQGLPPNVCLMLTSRFLETIDEELADFERMEIKAHKDDIELYIDAQIRKNRNLRRMVQRSPALRQDIKDVVTKTAQDMFLLARLHVESLVSAAALSVKHVRNKLQTLPMTLPETYDEAMRRITNQEPEHRAIALKALAWVSYAFRSLSLRELQHALAIEPGVAELDEELMIEGNNLISLCAGLIVIDQDTSVVNLVHYTTKNYFEDIRLTTFPGFHATITMSCATYLNLDVLKDASIWKIVRWYPLACYAAQHMAEHARQNPEDALEPPILDIICQLLSRPDKRRPLLALLDGLDLINAGFYSSFNPALHTQDDLGIREGTSTFSHDDTISESRPASIRTHSAPADLSSSETDATDTEDDLPSSQDTAVRTSGSPEVTALHLAASMGLAKVASMLLKSSPDVDALDENGNTALAVAMERGFAKAVEFLIESGACVDLADGHGRGVLLLAAERDWTRVAELIVQRGRATVAEDARGDHRGSVQAFIAAYYGKAADLKRSLDQKDVDLGGEKLEAGEMALFIAVERGHTDLVSILINAGVNVNAKDSTGQTSLHRATRRGNESIMQTLLQHGIDIEQKNDDGRTAWSANAQTCNEHILGILLKAGADPNTRGQQGVHEIYHAAARGDANYVRFLLKSGTNPSITTDFGWAPLHWSSSNGHVETVKLLLEAGADPSPVADQDKTPLDMAIQSNQSGTAELLRKAGGLRHQELASSLGRLSLSEPRTTTFRTTERASSGKEAQLGTDEGNIASRKRRFIFDESMYPLLIPGYFVYCPDEERQPGSKHSTYAISQPLGTGGTSLTIRHAEGLGRALFPEYLTGLATYLGSSDTLYEIVAKSVDYQHMELRGSPNGPFPGTIIMTKAWTGSWQTHHNHDGKSSLLFRTAPDWSKTNNDALRWTAEDGTLLARTGFIEKLPVLDIEIGVEHALQEVLIACWIARTWSTFQTVPTEETL